MVPRADGSRTSLQWVHRTQVHCRFVAALIVLLQGYLQLPVQGAVISTMLGGCIINLEDPVMQSWDRQTPSPAADVWVLSSHFDHSFRTHGGTGQVEIKSHPPHSLYRSDLC
ncbi:hypothetical protein FN846DRAFT_933771 [Sphaerosporella brunnea]|uniref:Uncharacterized protein n=1 Tax=Sphaerosporella brunnea TaxID=1250544 RepID=A0A5J5F674_9PEZI|nr:hypothetical protein FN846DRAFT_933771 [Sphaerosporella brunnea]